MSNTTDPAAVVQAFLDVLKRDVANDITWNGVIAGNMTPDDPVLTEDALMAVLAELKQLRAERISRGFLAQAYANGWYDAIAAHQAPGWVQREVGWTKYLAEVDAFLASKQGNIAPQQPEPSGDAT